MSSLRKAFFGLDAEEYVIHSSVSTMNILCSFPPKFWPFKIGSLKLKWHKNQEFSLSWRHEPSIKCISSSEQATFVFFIYQSFGNSVFKSYTQLKCKKLLFLCKNELNALFWFSSEQAAAARQNEARHENRGKPFWKQ